MKCGGRRIAVLADMLELGDSSELYHREIGRHAKKAGIDHILAYGDYSRQMVNEFGERGEYFKDKKEIYSRLKNLVKKGDVILFKGSRGMALEEMANRLMESV
jgi:UDP-N-acetylmuramoyl-tripeptide--D-alanyl-D-alanine ligase